MDSQDQHQDVDSQHQDMYYTNLLNGNSVVSLGDSPPLPPINPTNARKSVRGANFSSSEDKLLVAAWLNCTLDAVKATDQKHGQYWEKVSEFFHKYKETTTERTTKSLTHRWSFIQKATNNFCSYLAQVERLNPSGTTEQDKIDKAKIMYHSLQKCHFQFEHCWDLLKDKPKWINRNTMDKPKQNQKKVVVLTSTSTSNSCPSQNGSENEVIELERPMGRKAEKRKRTAQGMQSEERIQLSKMKYTLLEESRAQEKEFIRLQAEKIEFDKKTVLEKFRLKTKKIENAEKEADDRIMMMDLNVLPEFQRLYFQGRQQEIMMKRDQA